MSNELWIAVVSCAGTLFGSLFGVITAAKLTDYRLIQLERKVEKHNCIVERMTAAEIQIQEIHHRLDNHWDV